MTTIRLLVVAESPVVRAGLRALLAAEPGFVVAGAAGAIADAAVAGDDADVIVWVASPASLADAGPGTPWRADEALHEAATAQPAQAAQAAQPALVVLVDHVDHVHVDLARRALDAGIAALLPIDAGEPAVVAAIQAAAAGLVTLPRELAPLLAGNVSVEAASLAPPAIARIPLTPREREVLALLAQGLANKQIAPRLGITEHTVKAHVAAIYEKVGAGNRAEATVAAARLGLLLL